MADTSNTDMQHPEAILGGGGKEKIGTPDPAPAEDPQASPANLRAASYVVLFIAAVFIVNAMETGSYRTPWPVALITVLGGLGLLGYSWHLQYRAKNKK